VIAQMNKIINSKDELAISVAQMHTEQNSLGAGAIQELLMA
jgi:hypothetical protein